MYRLAQVHIQIPFGSYLKRCNMQYAMCNMQRHSKLTDHFGILGGSEMQGKARREMHVRVHPLRRYIRRLPCLGPETRADRLPYLTLLYEENENLWIYGEASCAVHPSGTVLLWAESC